MDQKTLDYYKSWVYEKKRAQYLGKPEYEENCDIEIERLEKEFPELSKIRDSSFREFKLSASEKPTISKASEGEVLTSKLVSERTKIK